MKKEKYIEKMVRLGISERETRVYLALLEKRELTALEIHQLTNVPRTKVYETIPRMILRGMCIEKKMGRNKKYQAVEPRRVLNNLIKVYESELEEKKKLAEDIGKMIYPKYNKGMQTVDSSEYVEIIKGISSIHERYVSLVRNTRKEFIGFVKPPYAHQHKRQKVNAQESIEFEILKKGVIIRSLYEFPNEEEIETTIDHIKKCIEAGEKARMIEKLPVKMYISDVKYMFMALDNPKVTASPLTMLVIEHPGFALATRILFNHLWDKAISFDKFKIKYTGGTFGKEEIS